MSDLISREALLKVIRDDRLTNASDAIYFITNAPAVSGEAGAYRHLYDDGWEYYDVSTGSDCSSCKALYTSPQQPQEQGELVRKAVADALEEAIKILDGHIDRAETLDQQEEFREAQARIRALIKRNAEGVESDDLKDAKRYRWLREVSRDPDADKPHCVITKEVLEKGNPARMVSYLKFDEALDAEIARAIAVKEGE